MSDEITEHIYVPCPECGRLTDVTSCALLYGITLIARCPTHDKYQVSLVGYPLVRVRKGEPAPEIAVGEIDRENYFVIREAN